MASVVKKAQAAHPHCRRVRNVVKHQNLALRACAEKQIPVKTKQNIQSHSKKAKKKRMMFEHKANRTFVSKYLEQLRNWKKNFKQDKFFKYRVISRRYLRKLSQSTPPQKAEQRRKISWDQNIEIVLFNDEDNIAAIKQSDRIRQTLLIDFS